jgi:hypothetical protein
VPTRRSSSAASPSILFVTPAHLRYGITRIVLGQRRALVDALARRGIRADCVVIADDGNADIAAEHGFPVIRRDNSHLGRRWNDGYQHAAEHGYSHIAPIGSDSWLHPGYLTSEHLPGQARHVLTSRHYAVVNEAGTMIAQLDITVSGGVGPHIIRTADIAHTGNRPVDEKLSRGCDHSLLTAIGRRGPLTYQWHDLHPYQYIGFRSHETQLNPYQPLVARYGIDSSRDPWGVLAQHYPADLVEQAREHYRDHGQPAPSSHRQRQEQFRLDRIEKRKQRAIREAANRQQRRQHA